MQSEGFLHLFSAQMLNPDTQIYIQGFKNFQKTLYLNQYGAMVKPHKFCNTAVWYLQKYN